MSEIINSFQKIKEAGKGLIPGVDRDTVPHVFLSLQPPKKRIVAKIEELLPLCEKPASRRVLCTPSRNP